MNPRQMIPKKTPVMNSGMCFPSRYLILGIGIPPFNLTNHSLDDVLNICPT